MNERKTELGRIRRLPNEPHWALWMECCEAWERMDDRQFHGEVSVDHGRVCRWGGTYHETHDFSAAWRASSHESSPDG